MIEGQFAVAFTAGLLAVANPCGFAMLPAYLTFFLGTEGQGDDARAGIARALGVSLSVSLGFVGTFAIVTAVIINAVDIRRWSPWVSIVIGVVMVGLSLVLLAGKELRIRTPRLDRGGSDRSFRQMALYGVSYAVVSLGCTLPAFMALVLSTMRSVSLVSGTTVFLFYGLAFTLLLTSLAVGIALANRGLVRAIQRVLPYVQQLSGAILLFAGAYVAYYGWYSLTRLGEEDFVVDRVTSLSNDVAVWINDTGPLLVGAVLAAIVVAAVAVVVGRRRSAA